jgi:hypothetical protein
MLDDLKFRLPQIIPLQLRRILYNLLLTNVKELQKLRNVPPSSGPSLMPFDEKRFIFVQVPKTGGTSLTCALANNLLHSHYKLRTWQLVFSEDEFNNYFKFAVVRNPWDRLVSAYHYLKQGGNNPTDRKWGEDNLKNYSNFDEFVKKWINNKNLYSYIHFIPQFEFVCLSSNAHNLDYLAKFETLESDFEFIKKKLDIKSNLRHENRSKRESFRKYYTDETRAIVESAYAKDIELFNYRFDE